MTDPTKTQPRGAQYTPRSDKPPRRSNRATEVAKQIADHPAYPWGALALGLALMGAGAWLVYRQFPTALGDKLFDGAFLVVGFCILPTMPTRLANGAKPLVGIVNAIRGTKDKDGAP